MLTLAILLLVVPEVILAAFLVALYRRAKRMSTTELVSRCTRAEIILGQAHDLLCDLVECAERPECNTVLEEVQEAWAVQILTNIQEHKNPDLCRKKQLSKHP